MKKIYMISNAHIDPMWQWEWEEGAAAAVSTFRAAADFCEEYDGYIFNHNEALLYKWVEEYEPELFERIKKLVKEGKWNIMGGWYLQPDCTMPSGESFTRQILTGIKYFKEKFGVRPRTAVNFDSFGHTRGLVQIMAKSGYNSYVFMRPENPGYEIEGNTDFIWKGFDGSEIMCHKIFGGYNTLLGRVKDKIDEYTAQMSDRMIGFMPWGVGNHGGGPSRKDLNIIAELQKTQSEFEFVHSCPEAYFDALIKSGIRLIEVDKSLTPRFVGCYTSMIQVKQKHRELENMYYSTEKMATQASMQGLMEYPRTELDNALEALLLAEFHDVLPGTSVQAVEKQALDSMGYAMNILSKIRARALFALCSGQRKAGEGEYPIFVYNPHPFKVRGVFACEFMLADQNWNDYFNVPAVYSDGKRIPAQLEKEGSTFNLDWRKRVVFEAELEESSVTRFDCIMEKAPARPVPEIKSADGKYIFDAERMHIEINCNTGLMDVCIIDGESVLKQDAFRLGVARDIPDPWKMDENRLNNFIGSFELMTPEEGAEFCGIDEPGNIRVVEDGEVRTVIEAYFKYKNSAMCLTYKIPKRGASFDVEVRVYSNLKDKMLKLIIPTVLSDAKYIGNTAFGIDDLYTDGTESVAQKWVAADNGEKAVAISNDGIYGSSFCDGEIQLSLLRSCGYCVHPIENRRLLPTDRFYPRAEQGERIYTFTVTSGKSDDVMSRVERMALVHNEKPYSLSFFPGKPDGKKSEKGVIINGNNINLSAFKMSEDGEGYIMRIYESKGEYSEAQIELKALEVSIKEKLSPFEVKTYKICGNSVVLTNMTEDM